MSNDPSQQSHTGGSEDDIDLVNTNARALIENEYFLARVSEIQSNTHRPHNRDEANARLDDLIEATFDCLGIPSSD